jgi:hypothetical protein
MRIHLHLEKTLLLICGLAGSWNVGVQSLIGQPALPQQSGTSVNIRIEDAEERAGPFVIAGQNYNVVLHLKRLANASDPGVAQTLASMDILETSGNLAYQEAFPYPVEQGRFLRNLSASAQPASGKTGAGLVVHYLERTGASQPGTAQTSESWQLFGSVNSKLAPLGKPAQITGGPTGGPYMGVVMRAVNGTVSVISQPDTFDMRVWTGNFYIFVPLRVDWSHGGFSQGQRCMEMSGGGMKESGCDMRIEAVQKPPTEEYTFTSLYSEAHENFGTPEHLVLQKDTRVEILGSRAITNWAEDGERIQPAFSDIWLHVRIDDRSGWIHGEEDFAAVGLPTGSPAQ